MNAFGISVSSLHNAPFISHHFCADHVLQLTAVKGFSGDIQDAIPHPVDDMEDTTMLALKKARALVTYFHSSAIASQKLADAQKAMNPNCTVLKLVCDIKTHWWSTHSLLERLLHLTDSLIYVVSQEFQFREHANTLTTLELMKLSDEDFQSFAQCIFPFKDAQKALEGESYVNLSLLPLKINDLHLSLSTCEASVDKDAGPNLYQLIQMMVCDFNSRRGDECTYSRVVVRVTRNRQLGIPSYAFWATALDPRTTKKLTKGLNHEDVDAV
jgi:hypothetical protein